jgi:hypothetical protein
LHLPFLFVIPKGDLLLLLPLFLHLPFLFVISDELALSEVEWGICCFASRTVTHQRPTGN